MKDNAIECSKGCYLYSMSREESSSSLKLAMAVGSKKVIVMRWRHQEEWYSFSNETVEGFENLAEIHASETPIAITIIGGANRDRALEGSNETVQVVVGTKHHFELHNINEDGHSSSSKLLTFEKGSYGAVSAIEVELKFSPSFIILCVQSCPGNRGSSIIYKFIKTSNTHLLSDPGR